MASSLARREEFLVNRFEVIPVLFGFDHEAMSLSQLDLQRCVFSVLPDGQTSFRPQMSGKKKKKKSLARDNGKPSQLQSREIP